MWKICAFVDIFDLCMTVHFDVIPFDKISTNIQSISPMYTFIPAMCPLSFDANKFARLLRPTEYISTSIPFALGHVIHDLI